jgi:hypothetical protein
MDRSLGLGYAAEDREASLFDLRGQGACLEEADNLGMRASMDMLIVAVGILIPVVPAVPVVMGMRMMVVLVVIPVVPVHEEAPSGHVSPLRAFEAARGHLDTEGGEGRRENLLADAEITE